MYPSLIYPQSQLMTLHPFEGLAEWRALAFRDLRDIPPRSPAECGRVRRCDAGPNIPLTRMPWRGPRARNLVEWADADFESLRFNGGMGSFRTAFVADREELAVILRRSKIRTLYRIAQANRG
jgi:hypothetical protein